MKHSTIVIGAGVSGLSAAVLLLLHGEAVTVVERGDLGKESSWAGGGILSPLLPWDYSEAVTRLALRSMRAFPEWIAKIEQISGRKAEFWPSGMRVLEVREPDRALAWCKAHGIAGEFERTGRGVALWLPTIAQVRNPFLMAALREAVLRLGGVIHTHCAARHGHSVKNRLLTIDTPQGPLDADHFVIATGAWSGVSMPGLRSVPNVRPIRGQMLLYKLDPGALETILCRDGIYVIPRRDGHILVGSTLEDAGFDKSTDEVTRARLHESASAMLPALAELQPVRHWAGLRPGAPDNIPIIDRHPDFDNVFVNTGQYRYGVTLAPASAELLVDLIEGRPPALDPLPYSWSRALERSWTPNL